MLGTWALRTLFPRRGWLHRAADVLRLGQSGPVAAIMRSRWVRSMLPAFAIQGYDMTPPIAPRAERALDRVRLDLPSGARMESGPEGLRILPAGVPRMRVAFFTTCVMDVMFPQVTRDAVRMLVLAGAEVVVPAGQTCCGALHAHSGLRREAKALARTNVDAFDAGDVRYVVTHSAGCGAALRDTGHLLHEDSRAEKASRFAERVRDVSEVLEELGLPSGASEQFSRRDSSRRLRVAYHDPCHLAHAQRVRSAPRRLIAALPGVELVDLPHSDWCCGSAGVYNLAHPDMADAQLEHKVDSIREVDPDVVVASNPGCQLHMARGVKRRGLATEVVHLVEVLAHAYPPGAPAPRAPASNQLP
jgi:glycolate oxidase iron-sulfur subunit